MRKFLQIVAIAGFAAALALSVLGLAAAWFPALDMINDGLPFTILGCIVVFALVYLVGLRALVVPVAILFALNVTAFGAGYEGVAPNAAPGAKRLLRVVSFNIWQHNRRFDAIRDYLLQQDADVVVLYEVTPKAKPLLDALGARYRNHVGETGIVILSKYKIMSNGRIDRAGMQPWNSMLVRSASLDVHGAEVEIAGAHLARPYYSELQQHDIGAIARYVLSHPGPLVLVGDFNMAPWTHTMRAFNQITRLGRFNSFHPTWPMQLHGTRTLPLVPIDNVFASRSFGKIDFQAGPYLGSDHRPVIADLGLAAPAQ
jgi:endonuclease/exonuclease/phosphatase (EEP) superfamily protein YafD